MSKALHWWQKVPVSIRKPLVLVVGCTFILAAAATGWLPGPGGIPLFLVGIAILATEFVWAEKFRDRVLEIIFYLGKKWRQHKVIGTIMAIAGATCSASLSYYIYRQTRG